MEHRHWLVVDSTVDGAPEVWVYHTQAEAEAGLASAIAEYDPETLPRLRDDYGEDAPYIEITRPLNEAIAEAKGDS